jgi:hypothetical protein
VYIYTKIQGEKVDGFININTIFPALGTIINIAGSCHHINPHLLCGVPGCILYVYFTLERKKKALIKSCTV